MKNKLFVMFMLVISSLLLTYVLVTSVNPIDTNFHTMDSCENRTSVIPIDSIPELNKSLNVSERFDYVYNRFKLFNTDLDSSTVITFNKVTKFYKLDRSDEMLDLCIGQLLLESGAKQYYGNSHHKKGELVMSHSGAVGISQIIPTTAYGYLTKYVTKEDGDDMLNLGCTPFEHILDKSLNRVEAVRLSKEWIEDETNNLILWGFIMNKKINGRSNITRALVSYNAGAGGVLAYIDSGGVLTDHSYIKGIRAKLNYVKRKL